MAAERFILLLPTVCFFIHRLPAASSRPMGPLAGVGPVPLRFEAFGKQRFAFYEGLWELRSVTRCVIFTEYH